MPLTPLDIHNKEFRRTFRGYNEAEVDDFLDEVVRDFEGLLRENARLKEEAEELRSTVKHYRSLEETLNSALVVAQETAEDVRRNAKKQADLIVEEAQAKAKETIKRAERDVERIARQHEELKRQMSVLRTRIREMVRAHLDLLDSQVREIESEETAVAEGGGGPSHEPSSAAAGAGRSPASREAQAADVSAGVRAKP